jgi:hypothetical protein
MDHMAGALYNCCSAAGGVGGLKQWVVAGPFMVRHNAVFYYPQILLPAFTAVYSRQINYQNNAVIYPL